MASASVLAKQVSKTGWSAQTDVVADDVDCVTEGEDVDVKVVVWAVVREEKRKRVRVVGREIYMLVDCLGIWTIYIK